MDRQKFRIKRTNVNYMNPGPPGFSGFSNPSFPCSGSTNFFPLSFSTNSLGLPMYSTRGRQILNSLSGDMTTYPIELRHCSITEHVLYYGISPPQQAILIVKMKIVILTLFLMG